ncbi:hypothetical protein AAVH_08610 [Aphelenchoides avenae]|nr:hypothetical protein AAVH_08610 [Aphelenchus avenae]
MHATIVIGTVGTADTRRAMAATMGLPTRGGTRMVEVEVIGGTMAESVRMAGSVDEAHVSFDGSVGTFCAFLCICFGFL